jgi:hypothetical protein
MKVIRVTEEFECSDEFAKDLLEDASKVGGDFKFNDQTRRSLAFVVGNIRLPRTIYYRPMAIGRVLGTALRNGNVVAVSVVSETSMPRYYVCDDANVYGEGSAVDIACSRSNATAFVID